MGIEGEKLVFDYLSRVGDLAHGTTMSAADRAALVNRLRDEIGQRRTEAGGAESRSEVRRILGRIGRPEDIVAEAAASGPPPAAGPVPGPRAPGGRDAEPVEPVRPARRPRPTGPAVPADPEERREPRDTWPDGKIGGFTGGIEIPELLRRTAGDFDDDDAYDDDAYDDDHRKGERRGPGSRPGVRLRKRSGADGDTDEDTDDYDDSYDDPAEGPDNDGDDDGDDDGHGDRPAPRRRGAPARPVRPAPATPGWRRRLRQSMGTRRVGGPIELLGAALLAAGAVVGSIYPLGLGWAVAYWSPRLGRREAQWATFGMPALVAAAYGLWFVGRGNGYWGEPLAEDTVGDAFSNDWPWLLRAAGLASAVFLTWRARRPRPAE